MLNETFKLVVDGYLPGVGEYYVEENFASLFNISRKRAQKILRSGPYDIKKDLDKPKADAFVKIIRELGVNCQAESTRYDTSHLSLM